MKNICFICGLDRETVKQKEIKKKFYFSKKKKNRLKIIRKKKKKKLYFITNKTFYLFSLKYSLIDSQMDTKITIKETIIYGIMFIIFII
jgi:formyltetrahydrofolate synthetase